MKINKVYKLTLILIPVILLTYSKIYASKPETMPKKTVKGFRGEAKTIAFQWLQKDKDFIALEFIPGNKGRFWNSGSLAGELADGRIVSINVKNDFFDGTPGIILDDLKALKFNAETSVFGPEEYKLLISKSFKLNKKLKEEEKGQERQIKRRIEQRLIEVLENELPAKERVILKKIKKELEPKIRKKIISQIEYEVKRKFPSANAEKLIYEITAKLNKESRLRINKSIQKKILAVKLDYEGDKEIRSFIDKVITYYRPNIESEIRAKYAFQESNRLERLRKISRGEPVKPLEKEKKETFFEKVKKLLGLN